MSRAIGWALALLPSRGRVIARPRFILNPDSAAIGRSRKEAACHPLSQVRLRKLLTPRPGLQGFSAVPIFLALRASASLMQLCSIAGYESHTSQQSFNPSKGSPSIRAALIGFSRTCPMKGVAIAASTIMLDSPSP